MPDDFSIFDDNQHMFYGLPEPLAFIRSEIERMLNAQVEGTTVHAIEAFDEPRFLTLGRELEDQPGKMVVTCFAVCFRATIDAASSTRREALDATFTACFAEVDEPGERRSRCWLDLHTDAAIHYDANAFETRFLEWRHE